MGSIFMWVRLCHQMVAHHIALLWTTFLPSSLVLKASSLVFGLTIGALPSTSKYLISYTLLLFIFTWPNQHNLPALITSLMHYIPGLLNSTPTGPSFTTVLHILFTACSNLDFLLDSPIFTTIKHSTCQTWNIPFCVQEKAQVAKLTPWTSTYS